MTRTFSPSSKLEYGRYYSQGLGAATNVLPMANLDILNINGCGKADYYYIYAYGVYPSEFDHSIYLDGVEVFPYHDSGDELRVKGIKTGKALNFPFFESYNSLGMVLYLVCHLDRSFSQSLRLNVQNGSGVRTMTVGAASRIHYWRL